MLKCLLRAGACLSVLLLCSCARAPAFDGAVYTTEYGLGPDKWATAWLLTRVVDPEARLVVVASGQPLPSGTVFDVEGSPLRRQGDQAAFEVTVKQYGVTDPVVLRMQRIVHDMEINFWGAGRTPDAPLLEGAFRDLQMAQGRDVVSPACYMAFFDQAYRTLQAEARKGGEVQSLDFMVDCDLADQLAAEQVNRIVPEVGVSDLLSEMQRGKSVVFVDVREPDEFMEARIPGARNVTLRDVNGAFVNEVKDVDYVVAYCVKDFRGFELAKALRKAGAMNAVILNPYGLAGWVSQGLPVAGAKGVEESEALAELNRCAAQGGAACLSRLASQAKGD